MNINDDEALMQQLRAAFAGAEVSAERRRAAQGAFAWRTIDEELLALSHDSWVEAQAVVRASTQEVPARSLSFEGGGIELEVELGGGQLTGQLMPAQACRITVQTPSGPPHAVTVDESGFFEIADIPGGPVRFRIELDEQTLLTPWLV
jgi:hypothetical protein